jgi:hypothetical protein
MAEVRELRGSVGVFAAEVGEPLAVWQVAALGLEARTTAIVAPRQSGKSRSLAVVALHRAFREPGHRALVVSAGEEASRRLLAEVRRVAAGSPLLAGSVVDELAGLLTLSNGSEVRSVPASERQVRGWSVDTLLCDEAGLISDELLLGAALPTTAARPDARIVLAGSANVAAGAFYDHAKLGEAGSEHVRTFRWSLSDCAWISPSAIEAARESMSALRFAAEFEGVFAGSADALFPRSALDRVTVDYRPDDLGGMLGPARVVAGVDWGMTTDHSAIVALGRLPVEAEGPTFGVRCAYAWPSGYPLHRVVGEIAGSPAHYDAVTAELNGLGGPSAEMLWRALAERGYFVGGGPRAPRWFVINDSESREETAARARRLRPAGFRTAKRGVHTSAGMKAATYSALRLLVDRERLLLPASATDLLRELLLLRVELTPTGGERIEASSGHDDLADALALSLTPYRDRAGDWCSLIGDLARPGERGPAVVTAAAADWVPGPGSMRVPRRPAWLSVRGPGITRPEGEPVDDDPLISRARAAVAAALRANDDQGGPDGPRGTPEAA